jgi:hypothetical protein
MDLDDSEARNDCAGEGQQLLFDRRTDRLTLHRATPLACEGGGFLDRRIWLRCEVGTEFYENNLNLNDHLEALGADRRRLLKLILRRNYGRLWGSALDSSGLWQSPLVSSCEYGNEPLGYIKSGEFLISWASVNFSRNTVPWFPSLNRTDEIIIMEYICVVIIILQLQFTKY